MFNFLFGFLVITIIIIGIIYGYFSEKKDWNNGICKESGLPWYQFDTTSQGDLGFTDGKGNYCWISWSCLVKNTLK